VDPDSPSGPTASEGGPAGAMARASARMAVLIEGGSSRVGEDGIVSVTIPVPVPTMSGLVVSEPLPDGRALRALTGDLLERGRPWSISVIGSVPEVVAQVAAELGLVRQVRPTMSTSLVRGRTRPPAVEEYRRVESDEDRATFARLCDDAFDLPPGTCSVLTSPGLTSEPSIRLFLAIRDGEPVGTAQTVLDPGGWLSVYQVTTAAHVRRLGVAERLMRFVLADGADRGAHTAQLQSSDMARPVYERIGFRDAHDDMVFFVAS
jgi:GNAT superfamily N-acetyltransferase